MRRPSFLHTLRNIHIIAHAAAMETEVKAIAAVMYRNDLSHGGLIAAKRLERAVRAVHRELPQQSWRTATQREREQALSAWLYDELQREDRK